MGPSRSIIAAGAAIAAALLLAGCTNATPAPTPDAGFAPPTPADPVSLTEIGTFSAVAQLKAGSSCTGTLIDTGVADGPAYVLTNGHCVGDVGLSQQGTRLDEDGWGTAEFFRAEGNLENTESVDVVQVAYSTMRQRDTAIVRLDATLGELEHDGIHAVPITDAEPESQATVTNVGVPVEGLVDDEWVMRRGTCSLDAQHTLIEFGWLWHDVWSNDCPGIIAGSSGSPLFAMDASGPTRIVAMINTTTAGANPADGGECWLNRPCQVTSGMVRMMPDTSYAQSVAGVGRCFDDETGVFSVGGACPLPISDVWAEESGGAFRGGGLPDGADRMPQVRLFARTAGPVRTALVPLGDGTACADASTYRGAPEHKAPASVEHTWDPAYGLTLPVDLPAEEGRYMLCAVRGDHYDAAASVLFEVDRTPPVLPASATVERFDGGVTVQPRIDPPELSAARFAWGPQGEIDCADASGFEDAFMFPLTLTSDDLPATYCVYGTDVAGNRTPVTEIEIPR